MRSFVLAEIEVKGYKLSILQTEEGDQFVCYEEPQPASRECDAIERYLVNEGMLGQKAQTTSAAKDLLTKKLVIHYEDGTVETYGAENASLIAYDSSHHEATIEMRGRFFTLSQVESIDCPETNG